jgi:transcriptional regulator with XRE-family HTH domain
MREKLINKPKKIGDPEQGLFGEALQEEMETKGVTIQQLSEKIGVTYEHTRRLIKGMAFPSKPLIGMLGSALKWDQARMEEMKRYTLQDKLRHKYDILPQQIYGRDPKFDKIERNLKKLNEEQFEMFSKMLESAARSARA